MPLTLSPKSNVYCTPALNADSSAMSFRYGGEALTAAPGSNASYNFIMTNLGAAASYEVASAPSSMGCSPTCVRRLLPV